MKKYVNLIFVVILIACSGYNKTKQDNKNVFIENDNYNHKYDLARSSKERLIVSVIDSLNSDEFKIPNTLNEIYLDFKFNGKYLNYGKATSTRKFILSRTINTKTLKAILASDNENFLIKPNQNFIKEKYSDFIFEMPYIQYSLKELASMRLEELNN
jgi:hypothetical protein